MPYCNNERSFNKKRFILNKALRNSTCSLWITLLNCLGLILLCRVINWMVTKPTTESQSSQRTCSTFVVTPIAIHSRQAYVNMKFWVLNRSFKKSVVHFVISSWTLWPKMQGSQRSQRRHNDHNEDTPKWQSDGKNLWMSESNQEFCTLEPLLLLLCCKKFHCLKTSTIQLDHFLFWHSRSHVSIAIWDWFVMDIVTKNAGSLRSQRRHNDHYDKL
jgi:hypothetical protein